MGHRLAGQKRDWETLAEIDPLWAILGDPKRRGRRWDVREFFATAEGTVTPVLEIAQELGVPARRQHALDFGCGVGRITQALASSFEDVVGLDISERMVELARELNDDRGGCTFLVSDTSELPFADDSLDLVFENLVLQHLPNLELVWRYVTEFLRIVRPDGLVVFQLPSWVSWPYRLQLRRRAYAVLRSLGLDEAFLQDRLKLTPIRMLIVRPQEAMVEIERAGGRVLHVEMRDETGEPLRYARYYVVAGAASSAS